MKKENTRLIIHDYLRNHPLNECIDFDESSILKFHWANDRLASDYIGYLKDEDVKTKKRIKSLKYEIEKLKEVPIWLRGKTGQIKSDLHNLYMSYLDPRIRSKWFEIEDILVSTYYESGPFITTKSMRWFNKEIFEKFIYLNLLDSKRFQRKFRLNIDVPYELKTGVNPFRIIPLRLKQISDNGVLFLFENYTFLNEDFKNQPVILRKNISKISEESNKLELCFSSREWLGALGDFSIDNNDLVNAISDRIKYRPKQIYCFLPFEKLRDHEEDGTNQGSTGIYHIENLFKETKYTLHKHIKAA